MHVSISKIAMKPVEQLEPVSNVPTEKTLT